MNATDDDPVLPALPTRTPQASREARSDRWLRISGVLPAKASGCTDTELMRRVLDALRSR